MSVCILIWHSYVLYWYISRFSSLIKFREVKYAFKICLSMEEDVYFVEKNRFIYTYMYLCIYNAHVQIYQMSDGGFIIFFSLPMHPCVTICEKYIIKNIKGDVVYVQIKYVFVKQKLNSYKTGNTLFSSTKNYHRLFIKRTFTILIFFWVSSIDLLFSCLKNIFFCHHFVQSYTIST